MNPAPSTNGHVSLDSPECSDLHVTVDVLDMLDSFDAEALARLTPAALAALASRLAALQSIVSAVMFERSIHLASPPHTDENVTPTAPSRMLDVDEAAALLNKPRRWLFDNAKRLPFTRRVSRKTLLCDESAMMRWLASRPHR